MFFSRTFHHRRLCGALLLLSLALGSCAQSLEQALNPSTPLDYKEQIVMEGALIAGEPIHNIRLSRTAEPILGSVSREASAISTATVKLRVNGREIPMRLQAQRAFSSTGTLLWSDPRSYYEAPGMVAEEGVRYEIVAEWQGKTARVSTLVPRKPEIISVQEIRGTRTENGFTFTVFTYEARFRVRAGEVYQVGAMTGASADTASATSNGTRGTGALASAIGADSTGIIAARSQTIFPDFIGGGMFRDPVNPNVVVYSFDEPFAEFFKSYQRAFRATDVFVVGGANVRWNVTGDGVGIVIGVASSRRRVR